MASPFPDLRAAAIDGRAHNIYYRQSQLEKLHQALLDHAMSLQEAIASDSNHTPAEIAIEIHLTVSELKRNYVALQPAQAHEDEYLLARGEDAPLNRKPVGIVYIKPCRHTLLYSVVAPLAAAVAAGNCVIVLLENSLKALPSLLRRILQSALHPDTFAVATSPLRDQSVLDSAIFVDQSSSEKWQAANRLASSPRSQTLAVVDRTADLRLAAKELATARVAFGGSSPYAPDVVLVNEFVKEEFLQALIEEAEVTALSNADAKPKSNHPSASKELETLLKQSPDARLILQKPTAAVVELPSSRRPYSLVAEKPDECRSRLLTMIPVTSLDDAIDLVSNSTTITNSPALAAYHFGNAATGKYLAQFIDARASFLNHVPRDLLVGPAFPTGRAFELEARYTAEMFSVPRPGFIKASASSREIAAVLGGKGGSGLLRRALEPLKVMKRKVGGGVGFFEQGFLMNAGLLLTVAISVMTVGGVWGVRNLKGLF